MESTGQKELDTIDIKNLTRFQKRQVVSLVERFTTENEESTTEGFTACPKCGKMHPKITKSGRTKGGKQMYLCHECRHRFVEDIGKPSYYSRYDISAWRVFMEDTPAGEDIGRECGEARHIPLHCMELEAQDNGEAEVVPG